MNKLTAQWYAKQVLDARKEMIRSRKLGRIYLVLSIVLLIILVLT